MKKLRILHITPWFPNPDHELAGVFILRQLQALNEHCYNEVLHLHFSDSKGMISEDFEGVKLNRKTFNPVVKKWIVKEKLVASYINKYLKTNKDDFDIINFYIAYPNAVSIGKFKKNFPNLKFTITDVWSAYYEEFHLPKGHKGRTRIENIFSHDIPLFLISHALGDDIKNFCGYDSLPHKVISIVINENDFNYKEKVKNPEVFTFCSVNNWTDLKNPALLIRAFNLMLKEDQNIQLVLAGSGKLSGQIVELIKELKLEEKVIYKGRIPQEELIQTIHDCQAYCQSSNYETSSSICAEALATGTPVISNEKGGIKEYITDLNGYIVPEATPEAWKDVMIKMKKNYSKYDGESISKSILADRKYETIGQTYFNYFQEVFNGK